MIIEWNGLPGTGKTTVAGEVKNILEQNEINCILKHQRPKTKIQKYFSYLFDGSLHLHYLARKYAKSIQGKNVREKIQISSLLVYYYRMYLDFQKSCPNKVLLIDQGIIQGLISIAHTDPIKNRKTLENVVRFISKKISFFIIDCELNPQLSFERIRIRNTNFGRLDNCEDVELKKNLDIQAENFKIVRDVIKRQTLYPHKEIDTSLDPHFNAELIVKDFFEAKHEKDN